MEETNKIANKKVGNSASCGIIVEKVSRRYLRQELKRKREVDAETGEQDWCGGKNVCLSIGKPWL